jgi:sulfite reductase (NADPH) flavoprotein alpha-component
LPETVFIRLFVRPKGTRNSWMACFPFDGGSDNHSKEVRMTVPMLPDNAPFTAAQRAWLNGFFAGVLSLEMVTAGAFAGEPVAVQPSLTTAAPAAEDGDFPWHDPALPIAERIELAQGRPVEQQMMAAMAQLDCGTCGYQCRTYAEAIARGTERSLTRCTPGGRETARKLKELMALAAA